MSETNIQYWKKELSIQIIGQQRFWLGIVVGLFTAISISCFFNYSREVLRFSTAIDADLLILTQKELSFFNYFFSFLSSVLGLSITLWVWMQTSSYNKNDRFKKRIFKQLSSTNSLLIFWVIILLISRVGTFLPLLLFGSEGYDNQLNLYEDFWILFVLIPIVIFLNNCIYVSIVYRSKKWMLWSFLSSLALGFLLNATTTVNQNVLNASYYQLYDKDYKYIDSEMGNAKDIYGVNFDPRTVEILKKWFTESSFDQVEHVKNAFRSNNAVSLDTIILQKIIIRNCKPAYWFDNDKSSINGWEYALPRDILRQLGHFDEDSPQGKELFETLKEMIDLVNIVEIDKEDYKGYTRTERRRYMKARSYSIHPLIVQLKEVISLLLADKKYSSLANRLPEIIESNR